MKKLLFGFLVILISCNNTPSEQPEAKKPTTDKERFLAVMEACFPEEPLKDRAKWEGRIKNLVNNIADKKVAQTAYTKNVAGQTLDIVEFSYDGEILAVMGEGNARINPIPHVAEKEIQSLVYGSDEMSSTGTAEREHIKTFYAALTEKSIIKFKTTLYRSIKEEGEKGETRWRSGGRKAWASSSQVYFFVRLFDGNTLKIKRSGDKYKIESENDLTVYFINPRLNGIWKTWKSN